MNDLEFREQLPESCPPSEAVPTDDITVYRFSFTKDGYISDDFTSHWNRYPARRKSFLESARNVWRMAYLYINRRSPYEMP